MQQHYTAAPIVGAVEITPAGGLFTGAIDDGLPEPPPPPDPAADRVNVADVTGGLREAIKMGRPLWVPNGPHQAPVKYAPAADVDVLCDREAIVHRAADAFLGTAYAIRWHGGRHVGKGHFILLNNRPAMPRLIDVQRTFFEATGWGDIISHGGWNNTPLTLDELIMIDVGGDLHDLARGVVQMNVTRKAYVERFDLRNYREFGLALACNGSQQDRAEGTTVRHITLVDGNSDGADPRGQAIDLHGRNVTMEHIRIERFYPKTPALRPPDGTEASYGKRIVCDAEDVEIIDASGYWVDKGQTATGTQGPKGAGTNLRKAKFIRTPECPAHVGGNGILDQGRGNHYQEIVAEGLLGCFYLSHNTTGPATLVKCRDTLRPVGSLADKGKSIFFNRSNLGSAGVLGLFECEVGEGWEDRAVHKGPDSITIDDFGNNWN